MTEAVSTDDARQETTPYFSIIIPMYNRAHTIRRCIDSCLKQSFKDYEVLVIDDASDQDDSVSIVESYTDPRVRLIERSENRGVCAARGLGVKHARGQWLIVYLDSDDAFQDAALETIYEQTQQAPEDVGEIRFCFWCETLQKVTPFPSLPLGVVGFVEYLRWLDVVVNSDLVACQRRAIYNRVSWPTDRRFETKLNLDIASNFRILMTDTVVGTMYGDAGNRITGTDRRSFDPRGLQVAYDNALASKELLGVYGDVLAKHAPGRFRRLKRMVGDFYLRAGHRFDGATAMLRYLSRHPLDWAGWGLLCFGLIGPRVLLGAIRFCKRRS